MSNQHSHGLDQSIGQQWVELSRDDKKKICDALIDRNQPDVMQEFASLVRFTRGYLHQQPAAEQSSLNEKRENYEDAYNEYFNIPRKRARKVAVKKEKLPVNRALKASHSDDEVVKGEHDSNDDF